MVLRLCGRSAGGAPRPPSSPWRALPTCVRSALPRPPTRAPSPQAGDNSGAQALYEHGALPALFGRYLSAARPLAADNVNLRFAAAARPHFDAAFGPAGERLLEYTSPRAFQSACAALRGGPAGAGFRAAQEEPVGRQPLELFSSWFREFGDREAGGAAPPLLVPRMVGLLDASAPGGGAGGGGSARGEAGEPAIVGFADAVAVFASKQRPKKLTVLASDLRSYNFVVKARARAQAAAAAAALEGGRPRAGGRNPEPP